MRPEWQRGTNLVEINTSGEQVWLSEPLRPWVSDRAGAATMVHQSRRYVSLCPPPHPDHDYPWRSAEESLERLKQSDSRVWRLRLRGALTKRASTFVQEWGSGRDVANVILLLGHANGNSGGSQRRWTITSAVNTYSGGFIFFPSFVLGRSKSPIPVSRIYEAMLMCLPAGSARAHTHVHTS